jgi:hypothetical protein
MSHQIIEVRKNKRVAIAGAKAAAVAMGYTLEDEE